MQDDLLLTNNGPFSFSINIASGMTYAVRAKTQPKGQICLVTNGSGVVDAANITNIAVTCNAANYVVGGSVSGLMRNGLVLQNNGQDYLPIAANGNFSFPTSVPSGGRYDVSVKTNPTGQICFIDNVSGTVGNADITNVSVSCIMQEYTLGGTVSGLTSGALVLENTSGTESVVVSGNGSFNFPSIFYNGMAYSVAVKSQPVNQTCSVRSNGDGVIGTSSVSNILVVCSPVFFGPTASVSYGPKQIILDWPAVDGATYYKISKTFEGATPTTVLLTDDLQATTYTDTVSVHLTDWASSYYLVSSCDANSCNDSQPISAVSESAIGYFKASNSETGDRFGNSVALSADGKTLAVGAPMESSNAVGINGDQSDNSALGSGAVYIFTLHAGTWVQQAYLKASNTEARDYFGSSIALSANGDTLVVGSPNEDGSAMGIDGDQSLNSQPASGAVYVFIRNLGSWSQQAYVKASNTGSVDNFGGSVAVSDDGNRIAVGAYGESSSALGINGDQNDDTIPYSGAVYIFTRNLGSWAQDAYVKASNTDRGDYFGWSVTLSRDGKTLAVGAMRESSSATGVNGNQGNDSLAELSGAVYVFSYDAGVWLQEAYIKASNTNDHDAFGIAVSLSGNGDSLAVGAKAEASTARGINGDQNNNARPYSGAAYVFTRSAGLWSQQAYIKAPNADGGDQFGSTIALSADGDCLAVGASNEAGNAIGINGDPTYNSMTNSGAVYVFTRGGGSWSPHSYVKAPNTNSNDMFGTSVALSASADSLAVGALFEASNATGINGDQTNNSAVNTGAVYLY
jgi:hypothetical protein